ncbi:porin family protein [Niabella drilacis]|uniref:Outer membrane protein beta-barrel domain-containing protein n=1 Tax=Niabella drilacis (strain DSM 25811 / CCM 8410 / CCUG 62505 / LMG 26954 / E90) TaxID=1285928 RepID=A0A1G6VGE9_NIADE|nr:porin family protein [Niabella drilacis]SDD52608.1 Outer membrane protein beta-barrel domain-containing protein [Niabella drilacis]
MQTIKTTALLVLCFFLTVTLKAQFHIGAKAGVNATKIDGKSFKEAFNYNYLLGAFAEIGISQKLSINPELIYSQASGTRDTSFKNVLPDFNKEQTKAKLNYLSIPVLLNLKLAGPLHIEAGPQFSILTSSDKDLLNNGKDAFKKGDFSMLGGVQLQLSAFRVSGRYVIGLSNVSDLPSQEKWKNQAIQVAVGIAL